VVPDPSPHSLRSWVEVAHGATIEEEVVVEQRHVVDSVGSGTTMVDANEEDSKLDKNLLW
jgi:hypothetical protein